MSESKLPSSAQKSEPPHTIAEQNNLSNISTGWRCRRCGQIWSLQNMEPPEVCDYCGDIGDWEKQTNPS